MRRGTNSCKNDPCPYSGTWRSDVGRKGGNKGWCKDCLKAEELEKRGVFRDDYGHLSFCCRSCTNSVRVIKEN